MCKSDIMNGTVSNNMFSAGGRIMNGMVPINCFQQDEEKNSSRQPTIMWCRPKRKVLKMHCLGEFGSTLI